MKVFSKWFLVICICALAGCVPAFACTTALVSSGASSNGRPMIWKQRDTAYEFSVLKHVMDGKYEFTAIFDANDTALASAYAGVNEKGFAIINNLSYNLSGCDCLRSNGALMRLALATCADVDEFLSLVGSFPVPRSFEANFGVADRNGNLCYVEIGDVSVKRYDVPDNGWLVRSNYSLSGRENEGRGFARYRTAEALMSKHKGKFSADYLFDTVSRSFYNEVLKTDVSKRNRKGMAVDLDFIPRTTSVCSICIEVPRQDEAENSALIWCSTGYPLGAYAVPVWQCAGDNIPSFLSSTADDIRSASSVLSQRIKNMLHPLERDASGIYIDFSLALPVIKLVRKYERTEYEYGLELDRKLRKGSFDKSLISKYNSEAEQRFVSFYNSF